MIHEDHLIHSEGFETFIEAFKVLFATFMIFNIKYPKQISLTLELIQRYFFKINPSSPSGNRMSTNTSKTISFIEKLKKL